MKKISIQDVVRLADFVGYDYDSDFYLDLQKIADYLNVPRNLVLSALINFSNCVLDIYGDIDNRLHIEVPAATAIKAVLLWLRLNGNKIETDFNFNDNSLTYENLQKVVDEYDKNEIIFPEYRFFLYYSDIKAYTVKDFFTGKECTVQDLQGRNISLGGIDPPKEEDFFYLETFVRISLDSAFWVV